MNIWKCGGCLTIEVNYQSRSKLKLDSFGGLNNLISYFLIILHQILQKFLVFLPKISFKLESENQFSSSLILWSMKCFNCKEISLYLGRRLPRLRKHLEGQIRIKNIVFNTSLCLHTSLFYLILCVCFCRYNSILL